MAAGNQTLIESAVIVQNTLTELLAGTIYGQVPADVVRVIEEFGIYGDLTAGTYFNMLAGTDILSNQSAVFATAFNRDNVATPKHPAKTNAAIRLYLFATAASPGRYKVWLKWKDFKLDELI
jgi:hypothetical protein